MTTSKRVQDRSKKKRVHELEAATEKWKITSKIVFLIELLEQEPEIVIPVRSLSHYRKQISLPKPHRISDFLRKTPKLFELYKDRNGVLWCGLTQKAEVLMEEHKRVIEENEDKAAEYVTRLLMMSVDKRVQLDKIAHFRRDFGLPMDFRTHWVHKYPQLFRVVKPSLDDVEFLELVSWNSEWAITEIEKKNKMIMEGVTETEHTPGLLSLPFPLKFPANFKRVHSYYGEKIKMFQERTYLSPYADAKGLKPGSLEFDKRAVAVMHELLSFTVEKRGKRFSVFLTEAYEGSELIEKSPLFLWREKLLSLVGYRGRKKKFEADSDSDEEGGDGLRLLQSDSDEEDLNVELEQQDTLEYKDPLLEDDSEMDVRGIS
ncbi:plant organelle RNA recognition domain protein [Medicago truncatula]|uniref:Plant organelle RNA recognition domain protein n=1 Tax=Medicago truncatula TaxID=3880 RepID=A0A072TH43_MEDTR|nr:plant organelle RNA recognition domain protein [Medicago truncatula]